MNRLITLAWLVAIPLIQATETPTDKLADTGNKPVATFFPIYNTAEQVKAMNPSKATVEQVDGCYARLRTTDGKLFDLGSPGVSKEVHGFLHTLKKGQTYDLPSAFIEYQKKRQPKK